MKSGYVIIVWIFVTSGRLICQDVQLDVGGAIQIANIETSGPMPGTLRWTGVDFQGWNGSKWVSLTSGVAFDEVLVDIDGNNYPVIRIGDQYWMAENLRVTRYNDGTTIPSLTSNSAWSSANYGMVLV